MSWYRLHRGWMDHPVFRNEPLSRHAAFAWLIENANYKPSRVFAPKGEISLERGQLCHSLRFMASAWRWDESKVRRFLTSLQNAKIIDAASDAGQTIVTICNYAKYQDVVDECDAGSDAATPQQRRSGDAKKKEGKEGKNNTPLPPEGVCVPEWVPSDAWDGFVKMRKSIKKPMTDRAMKMIIAKLSGFREAGYNPTEILDASTINGWQDIFEPKPKRRSNGSDDELPIC